MGEEANFEASNKLRDVTGVTPSPGRERVGVRGAMLKFSMMKLDYPNKSGNDGSWLNPPRRLRTLCLFFLPIKGEDKKWVLLILTTILTGISGFEIFSLAPAAKRTTSPMMKCHAQS